MLKKITIIVLMLSIMLGVAYAEEFTLHNGTMFGMDISEAIELEAKEGVRLKYREYVGDLYEGTGKVASFDNVDIMYYVANEKIFGMRYDFPVSKTLNTDDYINIEQNLIKKYGDTEFNSTTGLYLPSIDVYKDSLDRFILSFSDKLPDLNTPYGVWSRVLYSHRLVPLENEEYVLIEHTLYFNEEGINEVYFHKLGYNHLTNDEAQLFFDELAQMNDDL